MMIFKDRVIFLADTTVNIDPSAEDLADVAVLCAEAVKHFDMEPKIAMISFSNFGSTRHPFTKKVHVATEIVKSKHPGLIIDGEMQADTAVVPDILDNTYPFSALSGKGGANVLIFPSLESGNAAYKLLQRLGGAEAIGPILLGMRKPVHVLQIGSFDETDVVNMTAIAVVDAQKLKE
jgi:malate dehydrogenase (oxaloacetate-decarboxylating)(NADP+)